ncbi:MAG: ribosome recycling factor, partial [Nitrospira sp.]
MEATLEHLKRELAGLRTGRASLALLDNVRVDYYGTHTPLKQVANLAVPESRLITVQPWEAAQIKEIEKAIVNAGLGITPSNDGKIIRLPIPPLTEERRKDLIKVCKKYGEETKVKLRAVRHETNDDLKNAKLSEDDLRKAQ